MEVVPFGSQPWIAATTGFATRQNNRPRLAGVSASESRAGFFIIFERPVKAASVRKRANTGAGFESRLLAQGQSVKPDKLVPSLDR
jgi:hypothetical protein